VLDPLQIESDSQIPVAFLQIVPLALKFGVVGQVGDEPVHWRGNSQVMSVRPVELGEGERKQ